MERLDHISVQRWARLWNGVPRYQLRRGAWYPVLSVGSGEVVLVVRHQSRVVPLARLEIVGTQPTQWTVLPDGRYSVSVCPNCANRVTIARSSLPDRMRCERCGGVFAFESMQEGVAAH